MVSLITSSGFAKPSHTQASQQPLANLQNSKTATAHIPISLITQSVNNAMNSYIPPKNIEALLGIEQIAIQNARLYNLAAVEELFQMILNGEDIEAMIEAEIAALLNPPATNSSSSKKASMIKIILELDITQFLATLSRRTAANQEELLILINAIVSLQSRTAEMLSVHQKESYDEQTQKMIEANNKTAQETKFLGFVKIAVAWLVVGVATVSSAGLLTPIVTTAFAIPTTSSAAMQIAAANYVLSGGESYLSPLLTIVMLINPAALIAVGGLIIANPSNEEQIESIMKYGLVGTFTTDDATARIIKGIYQLSAAAASMGTSILSSAANIGTSAKEVSKKILVSVADDAAKAATGAAKAATDVTDDAAKAATGVTDDAAKAATGVADYVVKATLEDRIEAQKVLSKIILQWFGIALETVDSALKIGGQAWSMALGVQETVDENQRALAQGASMGMAGLAIKTILTIPEVREGLIDAFGEQGAEIFTMVLTALASISSIIIIKGMQSESNDFLAMWTNIKSLAESLYNLPQTVVKFIKNKANIALTRFKQLYHFIKNGFKNLSIESFTAKVVELYNSAIEAIDDLISTLKPWGTSFSPWIETLEQLKSSAYNTFKELLFKIGDFIQSIALILKSTKNRIPRFSNSTRTRLKDILAELKNPQDMMRLSITAGIMINSQASLDSLQYSSVNLIEAELSKDLITSRELLNVLSESLQTMTTSLEFQQSGTEKITSIFSEFLSTLAESLQEANSAERQVIRSSTAAI